jgi:hypothetical protein
MRRKRPPLACPRCKTDRAIRIVYGEPAPDVFEAADRGEIEIGGCVVTEDSPARRCKACGHAFGVLHAGG